MAKIEIRHPAVIITLFIIANLAIFICAIQQPINWLQKEILAHRFFFATNSVNDLTLHTGLTFIDWLKPLNTYYVEGFFRLRHFSYYIEMLSFKFWQMFDVGYFHNYTLILLHVINALLAALLIYRLTKSKPASVITGLFLLNAGCALTTLLFPFRNAKVLLVTLFLLAWHLLINRNKPFSKLSRSRLIGFYTCLVLALFTDEVIVFLAPILMYYIFVRHGKDALINRRLIVSSVAAIGVSVGLAILFYTASHLSIDVKHTGYHGWFFEGTFKYWSKPHLVIYDCLRSIFIFCRRNLGYWDMSPFGLLAFIAMFVLSFVILKSRPKGWPIKLAQALGCMILLKTFMLPQIAGVHPVIMPRDTFFPSLLFFSYYYVYVETFLLAMIIGFLSSTFKDFNNAALIAIAVVSVISLSNALHQQEGLQDTLIYHRALKENKQKQFERVKAIKPLLKEEHLRPVYLSFNSGNKKIVDHRLHNPRPNTYLGNIPLAYLPSLEKGEAIISLKNIKPKVSFPHTNELLNANTFYDVSKQEAIDLVALRELTGSKAFMPIKVNNGQKLETQLKLTEDDAYILLFVRGKAKLFADFDSFVYWHDQTYGYAYQMIKVDLKRYPAQYPKTINLSLVPFPQIDHIHLVGPFVLKEDVVIKY